MSGLAGMVAGESAISTVGIGLGLNYRYYFYAHFLYYNKYFIYKIII